MEMTRKVRVTALRFALGISILAMIGCAAASIHPGAVSTLDSTTYDALVTANAAINQAKSDVAAGTLSASGNQIINDTVAAYNVARGAWLAYRHAVEALAPGSAAPAAETAALQSALASLTEAIANLQSLITSGGK
jgi:hypothetical protein